ncbi:hypothetical protein CKF46_36665, partial [Klebsiella pneumoniae]
RGPALFTDSFSPSRVASPASPAAAEERDGRQHDEAQVLQHQPIVAAQLFSPTAFRPAASRLRHRPLQPKNEMAAST